jgi:hypothetical protein
LPSHIQTAQSSNLAAIAKMSDSDDEDIKRAIALSLQANSSPPAISTPAAVIDLTSSDDDDDLDAPVHTKSSISSKQPPRKHDHRISVVELSDDEPKAIVIKDEGQTASVAPSSIKSQAPVSDSASKPQPLSSSSAMLGLDRKQMEAMRLARAQQKKQREEEQLSALNDSRKRKASISDAHPGTQDGRQVKAKFWEPTQTTQQDTADHKPIFRSALASGSRTKDASLTQASHSLPLREPFSAASQPSEPATKLTAPDVLSFNQQQALQASGVQFPDGVIKRTWVKGCPREDDIKIEEIFQKDDLELAVLSTFQVEPDWVSEKLLDKTKVIWVLQAKDEREVS